MVRKGCVVAGWEEACGWHEGCCTRVVLHREGDVVLEGVWLGDQVVWLGGVDL